MTSLLLVEDDADLRESMRMILDAHYAVTACADGNEGLAKGLELKPNLVLTDINMPGLNGLEMVARMRKAELYCPVIFITGYADARNVREANRLGAFDFLEKPVRTEKVLSTVRNALLMGNKFISTIAKVDADLELSAASNDVSFTLQLPESLLKELKAYAVMRSQDPNQVVVDLLTAKLK